MDRLVVFVNTLLCLHISILFASLVMLLEHSWICVTLLFNFIKCPRMSWLSSYFILYFFPRLKVAQELLTLWQTQWCKNSGIQHLLWSHLMIVILKGMQNFPRTSLKFCWCETDWDMKNHLLKCILRIASLIMWFPGNLVSSLTIPSGFFCSELSALMASDGTDGKFPYPSLGLGNSFAFKFEDLRGRMHRINCGKWQSKATYHCKDAWIWLSLVAFFGQSLVTYVSFLANEHFEWLWCRTG